MKSVLAFAAGMFAGVLLAIGAETSFRQPQAPGAGGAAHLEGPVRERGLSGAVRDGLAALVSGAVRGDVPRIRRWPVSQAVRMAASGVILAQSASPRPADDRTDAPVETSSSPAVQPASASRGGNATPLDVVIMPELPVSVPPVVDVSRPSSEAQAVSASSGGNETFPDVRNDPESPRSAPPVVEASRPVPADPEKSYAAALGSYEAGSYEASREQFAAFLQSFPHHRLAPNALYWTGETWYAQARYDKASEAFERVLREFPRHDKSPDALLKLAYSALRQGMAAKARDYLDRLQTAYPDSRASRLGRQARSRLQGSSEAGTMVVRRG